jgi:hypothetical protein
MRYKRFSRVAWTSSIPKFWQFFKESDFFNISNDAGRVKELLLVDFAVSRTPSRQRRRTGCFRESNDPAASMVYIQPHGSARFLHHCGGVAHQTSLRSPSIMMCYANSPPFGEAGSLFS